MSISKGLTNQELKERVDELVGQVAVDAPNWGDVQELARHAQTATGRLMGAPTPADKP